MNREELLKKFEKNVQYLQRNIPPDDIYIFAEQTFMAAMFFLNKYSTWVDIEEEMKNCSVTEKWVNNIVYFHQTKELGIDVELDLNFKSSEDE